MAKRTKKKTSARRRSAFRNDFSVIALAVAAAIGIWIYSGTQDKFTALLAGGIAFAVLSLEALRHSLNLLETAIKVNGKIAFEFVKQAGKNLSEWTKAWKAVRIEQERTKRLYADIMGRRVNEQQRGANAVLRYHIAEEKKRSKSRRTLPPPSQMDLEPPSHSRIDEIINGSYEILPDEEDDYDWDEI